MAIAWLLGALMTTCACLEAPPEGSPVDDGAAELACFQRFGSAQDYMLCAAAEDSCTFFLDLQGDFTCTMACEAFGTICLDGYVEATEDTCTLGLHDGCDESEGDQICQCALPPAGR